MSLLKKQIKGKSVRSFIDLESIFLYLLIIRQQQEIKREHLFAYELCAVPSSLIDEHGCLRKGSKPDLVKRLGVPETLPATPDTIILDVLQLFYHIVWPNGGSPSGLISSIKARTSRYSDDADKIVVFDKYQGISAKDHE